METPAPLAVPVEIRALDVGPRIERVWRLSRAVGEAGVRLWQDLPFEAGRPVRVELRLPDDERAITADGRVVPVPPDDESREGETARPRAVAFTALDPAAKERLAHYVEERMLP